MADPIQLEFEFPDNTGPISSSWSGLATISKDMRDSWEAINLAMDTTMDKADKLREKLDLKDEVLSGIRTMLGEITTAINTNDATLRNSLQMINQIMGSSNSVAQLTSRIDGYAPQGQNGFSNPLAGPMQYAAAANQVRQRQVDPFNSPSAMSSQFADYNQPTFFGKHATIRPNPEELGNANGSGRGRGGGGGRGTSNDMGEFDDEFDPMNQTPHGTEGAGAAEYSTPPGQFGMHQTPRPVPDKIGGVIKNQAMLQPLLDKSGGFSNEAQQLLNQGNYNALTSQAIHGGMGAISQSALGVIPGIGGALGQLAGILSAMATNKNAGEGNFSDIQTKILEKLGNAVEKFTQSPAAITAAKYASLGAGTFNAIRGTQNAVLGGYSYPSQALANVTGGQVQYMPWNGNNALAFQASNYLYSMQHGVGMTYSSQDAQTASMAAMQLGLKGGAETNYKNLDYTAQTKYGLSHGETQQTINTALAYGVNTNQMMSGLYDARTSANQIGNTPMSYTDMAYQMGVAKSASLGYQGQAAIAMGKSSAAFGAGNQIAANAGMTGQELMGTTLGTALFAQQAGVSFMNAYAAAENMSGAQAQKLQSNAMIGLLVNLGIPVNSIQKSSDLNPYAIKLGIILPQLGVTDVTTPQQAVVWAWEIIKQSRGISSNAGPSNPALGVPGTGTQGVPANSTLLGSTNNNSNLLQSLNNVGFNSTGLGAGGSASATTSNGVTVQVNLAPGLQNIITATVQSANAAATSPSARVNNPSGA